MPVKLNVLAVVPGPPPDFTVPGGGGGGGGGGAPPDPLRPRLTSVFATADTSAHSVSDVLFSLPPDATTEISVLVVADSAADAAVFYLHASYRRAGGSPAALVYAASGDNSARSAGAASWTAAITLTGNDASVTVQEPGGTAVTWTIEVQYTIGALGP